MERLFSKARRSGLASRTGQAVRGPVSILESGPGVGAHPESEVTTQSAADTAACRCWPILRWYVKRVPRICFLPVAVGTGCTPLPNSRPHPQYTVRNTDDPIRRPPSHRVPLVYAPMTWSTWDGSVADCCECVDLVCAILSERLLACEIKSYISKDARNLSRGSRALPYEIS